jgi:hypothetical protein
MRHNTNTQELRELLDALIKVWPAEQDHPYVELARDYLDPDSPAFSMPETATAQNEDYHDALWYSL